MGKRRQAVQTVLEEIELKSKNSIYIAIDQNMEEI